MPILNESNSSVDKNSGAVFFHRSPELNSIIQLQREVKEINEKLNKLDEKLDKIIRMLREVDENG